MSEAQIKRLYRRFKKLDRDNLGVLSTDDFLSISELAFNPLVMRVISNFDKEVLNTTTAHAKE